MVIFVILLHFTYMIIEEETNNCIILDKNRFFRKKKRQKALFCHTQENVHHTLHYIFISSLPVHFLALPIYFTSDTNSEKKINIKLFTVHYTNI